MRIVILGPPGSGKGTQAEKLSEKFGLKHLSVGDLLREAVANGTVLGKKAKPYMAKGELVPDPIILDLIKEYIDKYSDGFILDGFPRNLNQAKELDEYLKEHQKNLDIVLNIDVDENTVIERLKGRLVCPKCGRVYSVNSLPSSMVCPRCGAKLEHRMDDNEDTIRNRMRVYQKLTLPLIDYYKKRGLLHNISGKGSPDEVFERIVKLL
ncbi:adenylate kinase [Candidatus Aerophobetes bacterium]|nr:adenylate kinase [Candidatus Aerophobetes bacterium]